MAAGPHDYGAAAELRRIPASRAFDDIQAEIAFRERWFHAAIAVLERTQRASALQSVVETALLAYPGQPRFELARAVTAEIRTSPDGGV